MTRRMIFKLLRNLKAGEVHVIAGIRVERNTEEGPFNGYPRINGIIAAGPLYRWVNEIASALKRANAQKKADEDYVNACEATEYRRLGIR